MQRERKNRTSGTLKWVSGIAAALLLLIAVGAWLLFGFNRFSLSLELNGDGETVLEYGEAYTEPDCTAVLRGTRFLQDGFAPANAKVTVSGELNREKLGKYTLTYAAKYLFWNAEATRLVRVADSQSPVILLEEGADVTLLSGGHYSEPGFIATDNYDGDITDKVVRTEENGVIYYAVFDSSGNPAYARRAAPPMDNQSPEIHLEGGEQLSIRTGTWFEEPGYSAFDIQDGDLTARVSVEGQVLWYESGTYTLTYTVSDSMNNVSVAHRVVEVTAEPRGEIVSPEGKVIYLTFDDGPGPYTEQLLDVLAEYGVKATFFVTDSGYTAAMKKIVEQGHSIGIHTMSHNYERIYADPEAYFQDILGMQDVIYKNTGVKTNLLRFPGGSSNTISRHYYEGVMTLLTEAVQDAGFRYFDWNVDSNDAGGAKKSETVFDNVTNGVTRQRISVVLQHDIRSYSVEAVGKIIQWGLDNGYTFLPLRQDSPPMHHGVNN